MRTPRESAPTSAASEGLEWSARATAWAELWGELAMPAFQAVANGTGIGAGARVLDVGCGNGEFCRLAAERGAEVSGIDAAEVTGLSCGDCRARAGASAGLQRDVRGSFRRGQSHRAGRLLLWQPRSRACYPRDTAPQPCITEAS